MTKLKDTIALLCFAALASLPFIAFAITGVLFAIYF